MTEIEGIAVDVMAGRLDPDRLKINVEVQFWGPFRQFSLQTSVTFKMPNGSTVNDLMEVLYSKYGMEFKGYILDENAGQFWNLMAIAHNSRILSDVNALHIPLCEGDKLLLLPPALGG